MREGTEKKRREVRMGRKERRKRTGHIAAEISGLEPFLIAYPDIRGLTGSSDGFHSLLLKHCMAAKEREREREGIWSSRKMR